MSPETAAAIISGSFAVLVVAVQVFVYRGNKLSNSLGHEIRDDVRDIKADVRDIKNDVRRNEERIGRLETPSS